LRSYDVDEVIKFTCPRGAGSPPRRGRILRDRAVRRRLGKFSINTVGLVRWCVVVVVQSYVHDINADFISPNSSDINQPGRSASSICFSSKERARCRFNINVTSTCLYSKFTAATLDAIIAGIQGAP
jgi:hypothetical protein